MIVRVKLFAVARQLAGSEEIEVDVQEPATIAALRVAIGRQFPQLASILRPALFAINTEYSGDSTAVPPDSEVACIPPVSGG